MTFEQYESLIRETLDDKTSFAGETLYSSIKTLEGSDVYLMGVNPGGDDKWTIEEDLTKLKNRSLDYNEYFDGIWPNGNNTQPLAGEENLQKKMKSFFNNIDYDLKKACASNLIFFTSVDVDSLLKKMNMTFDSIADICWPVHEKILENLKPKVVIGFGNAESNSPYSYLKKKYNIKNEDVNKILVGHGNNAAKIFKYQHINFVFIPHLSRFSVNNEELFDYIKDKLN